MVENATGKVIAQALQAYREKKDLPQARFAVRLNQEKTAEAVVMLKKLAVHSLSDGNGAISDVDSGMLFLALLHGATMGLPEVTDGNAHAEEFAKAILFPVPAKGEDGETVKESARRSSRRKASKKK